MPTSGSQIQTSTTYRPRRWHHKSRKGCLECKRRKIKCNEAKPSCTHCILTLQKCFYAPSLPASASKSQRDVPPRQPRILSLPPNPPSSEPSLGRSPSPEATTPDNMASVDPGLCYSIEEAPTQLSDADLYHHYIQHTSRTITPSPKDQLSVQIGIPTLALKSKPVFHSLLAVSAVCIGCDMISKSHAPSPSDINRVLMVGYRHYNLASEQLRKLISQLDDLAVEPLLASNILLVPFAAASQQLNHWISSRSGTTNPRQPLSSMPRDIIVIMRGIKTILQALDGRDTGQDRGMPQGEVTIEGIPLLDFNIPPPVSASRTHVMFPLISSTSQDAFTSLQGRLDSAERNLFRDLHPDDPLSACNAAFGVLDDIRVRTFSSSTSLAFVSPTNTSRKTLQLKQRWLPQVSPWLRDYAARSASESPSEPLTRSFLIFLVQVPQSYLDLVLPLLEQRLETPTPDAAPIHLTAEEALALDIYAHWSVLMFLVERESWWIGSLPVVTLTGMINRYGDDFVSGLQSDQECGRCRWWPSTMLNISRELKRR